MTAISVKGLVKDYGTLKALKGVSWDVPEGCFCALLGPNGAGKTTLIHCITGLATPTKGSIEVFGKDVVRDYREARRMIGLSQQDINMDFYFKIFDILVYQAGYFGVHKGIAKKRAEKLLKTFGIWDKRNETYRKLSGGMKRKVEIAKALMHGPKILILDEPTAGLDVQTRKDLYKVITKLNKEGLTIVLTTHYIEEAQELCDDITIINHGKIIARDKTRDLMKSIASKRIKATYDKPPKRIKGASIKGVEATIELAAKDSEEEVIRKLQEAGRIVSIETESPSLEEVFLELTIK